MRTPAITLLVLCAACSDASTKATASSDSLTAVVRDSAGMRVMRMSLSPAEHWPEGVPLVSEPVIGSDQIEFGAVIDLAILPDGTVAALDDRLKHVFLFRPNGAVDRLTREGQGPGELGTTLALEALDSLLLVWQLPRGNPTVLFVLGPTGRVVGAARAPVAGDWVRVTARLPKLEIDGLQRGTEDLTRRVAALGDSAFLFVIETDEYDPASQDISARREASILLIDTTLVVRDTVAVLEPSTTRRRVDGVLAPFPVFEQPLYAARPLVASGRGWYSVGHSSQDFIDVFGSDLRPIARIEWPRSLRQIKEAERRAGAGWILSLRVTNSEGSARRYAQASAFERAKVLEAEANTLTTFAENAPSSAGLLGAGECLFIQNFDPSNHPLGSGKSIAAFNVRTGALHGPFLIEGAGGVASIDELDQRTFVTVRAATTQALYAIRREKNGEQSLLKFRIPDGICVGQ